MTRYPLLQPTKKIQTCACTFFIGLGDSSREPGGGASPFLKNPSEVGAGWFSCFFGASWTHPMRGCCATVVPSDCAGFQAWLEPAPPLGPPTLCVARGVG